ncbi:hypothetical protein ACWEGX_43655 [Streptomyces chartreusis]
MVSAGPEGLYVECADVRGCLSAGDGIDYDQATGVIAADISTDAGNQTTIGTDGGIYTPAGDATAVEGGTTPTASNTGTGSPGTPFVVSTDVILDPTPPGGRSNLLQTSPDGLYVDCSDVRGCISAGDGIDYDPVTGIIAADISGDAGNQTNIGIISGFERTTGM